MPPQDAGKRLPLGQGNADAVGGGMLPLLPGGWQHKKMNRGMSRNVLLGTLLVVALTATAFSSTVFALDGSGIGNSIAAAIRGVIVEIINILTPIINILGVGMIVIGLLLGLGLRQEFLGFRLAIGGALALLTIHVIVPLLLGFV
jgi:hypothetical protein